MRAAPNAVQRRLCWPAAHVSSKHLPDLHAIHGEEDVAGRDAAARVRRRAFDKGLHDARCHVTMPCTSAPQIVSAADPQRSLIFACAGFGERRAREHGPSGASSTRPTPARSSSMAARAPGCGAASALFLRSPDVLYPTAADCSWALGLSTEVLLCPLYEVGTEEFFCSTGHWYKRSVPMSYHYDCVTKNSDVSLYDRDTPLTRQRHGRKKCSCSFFFSHPCAAG